MLVHVWHVVQFFIPASSSGKPDGSAMIAVVPQRLQNEMGDIGARDRCPLVRHARERLPVPAGEGPVRKPKRADDRIVEAVRLDVLHSRPVVPFSCELLISANHDLVAILMIQNRRSRPGTDKLPAIGDGRQLVSCGNQASCDPAAAAPDPFNLLRSGMSARATTITRALRTAADQYSPP